ncbi:MAG: methyltransferase domain-containing protein [Kiritimatiellaceae bacterium]|nr:methyltransferase domain-containing protein [Kiritimatiellaceae bacterium]
MTTDFLEYLMEDPQEIERLERKTDPAEVLDQARWAGLSAGMRVADIGCGPGLTSSILFDAVQPGGEVVGVDFSAGRILHAQKRYQRKGLFFQREDFFGDLSSLGVFDFVWARFALEFHRSRAVQLAANLSRLVRPGGVLCLIDLDYNCLNHAGLPARVDETIREVVNGLEKNADFDPYAGRRLYSHLFDLGYQNIRLDMTSHHLIYGELDETDRFNWERKVLVAARRSGCDFALYQGDFNEFAREFSASFMNPRRFTYTPLINCCGRKPNIT